MYLLSKPRIQTPVLPKRRERGKEGRGRRGQKRRGKEKKSVYQWLSGKSSEWSGHG
jgi:hypothetical protein